MIKYRKIQELWSIFDIGSFQHLWQVILAIIESYYRVFQVEKLLDQF